MYSKSACVVGHQGAETFTGPNVLYTDMSLGWDLIMTALETEAVNDAFYMAGRLGLDAEGC